MTLNQVLGQLASLGNGKTRAHNQKWGAGPNQYGVKHGDLRVLAKQLRDHSELAPRLWETGNVDAQLLAALLFPPKTLTASQVEKLVPQISFAHVADWLTASVIKPHPEKESLRTKWLRGRERWGARIGWALTAERIVKNRDGLDLQALLERIETELADADPVVQWTMNGALAEIGIHEPKLRRRALAIGERIGLYRDYPTSKGCTSPFAPIWIAAMVKRQKS